MRIHSSVPARAVRATCSSTLRLPALLQEELSAHVAPALEGEPPLATERGLLQLALDCQLLAYVLALPTSGAPHSPRAEASAPASEPLPQLLQRIGAQMDPIDWATYAPHLQRHAREAKQQMGVCLGLLLQRPPPLKARSYCGCFNCVRSVLRKMRFAAWYMCMPPKTQLLDCLTMLAFTRACLGPQLAFRNQPKGWFSTFTSYCQSGAQTCWSSSSCVLVAVPALLLQHALPFHCTHTRQHG